MKRASSIIMSFLLLASALAFSFITQNVKASGTIYIRADGSIDPSDAPISTVDNITYTLTGNITSDADGIVVERGNVIIDGAGYTLQGTGAYSRGISWGVSNVTIKNANVKNFHRCIWLDRSANNTIYGNNITASEWNGICLNYSSSNTIYGNNITNTEFGILLVNYSSSNTIYGNNITNGGGGISLWDSSNSNTIYENNITNARYGISLLPSSNSTIYGNNITNNVGYTGIYLFGSSSNNKIYGNAIRNTDGCGIWLDSSPSNNKIYENDITANSVNGIYLGYSSNSNTIYGNDITNARYGISFLCSSNNMIYHNNFVDSTYQQVWSYESMNVWDDGYPSGGNYWNDYNGIDVKKGLDQDEPGSDGIGDSPVVIDASNEDGYPLMDPYGSPPPPSYALTITTTSGGTTNPAPGAYTYSQGQNVPVDAMPNAGYGLDHWEFDGSNVGAASPIGVLMDTDHALHAVFSPVHDIAVINVVPSKTIIGQGYSLNINVTAANQGGFTETFNVTIYANTTEIETREITLTSEDSTTITFTWNTTGFAYGNYTISAYAEPVPGETDTADNNRTDGSILITKVGDFGGGVPPAFFNCDGSVDGKDLALFLQCYKGTAPAEAMYLGDLGGGVPPQFYNCDGKVDGKDLSLFLQCYKGLGP